MCLRNNSPGIDVKDKGDRLLLEEFNSQKDKIVPSVMHIPKC